MLTRRKNRVKKNGKKRYMSRKMRGGSDKNAELNKKFEEFIEKYITKLKTDIDSLTSSINELNAGINNAKQKIVILDFNKIISNEYDTNKQNFYKKLKEFEKAYNITIESILPSVLSIPAKNADTATKAEYACTYAEYKKFTEVYDKIKKHNNVKNKNREHDYFYNYFDNINDVFNKKKENYIGFIGNKIYTDDIKQLIIDKVNFDYTISLIEYYEKIHKSLYPIIQTALAPGTDSLIQYIDEINKIDISTLKNPIENPPTVTGISITEEDYNNVGLTKRDETNDIAYIFYRLHDAELVKTFLEEWIKVLNEEKGEAEGKVKEGEADGKKEGEKKGYGDNGEDMAGGAKENKIENKLKELLSKIYINEVRDKIQKEFDEISKAKLDEKIKTVTKKIKEVTENIKKYKEIKNNKEFQQIIYKIITEKIKDESNKPQYTDAMTRENAMKILHVYDEKNSKEIKDKYKMTKDMWTDILNNVTEKDRKPLINKILNKVTHAYDTLYQDKETTIDINFYKSIFKENPFPYKELVNVTRTGEDVTPHIYGVEELFKLYENELKFIKDNKSNDAVKPPLKQKKIEITHKRKNPGFPSIFDSFA